MLSRVLIGLITGGIAAALLVSALLVASPPGHSEVYPGILLAASVFAGVGLALAAENMRRAIGLSLGYAGLAGLAASIVGHLAALDLMFMDLSMEQRQMARMNGTTALIVGVVALMMAGFALRARRRLSAGQVRIREDQDHLFGINTFIANEIQGWLGAHERDLYVSNRARLLMLGLGLPAMVAGILAVTTYYSPASPPLWITATLAVIALGLYCVAFAPRLQASTNARNEIIRRLCLFFGLRHNDQGNGLELAPFRRLLLVPRYHRTRLDNVLWGRMGGHNLFMAEATLQARTDRLTPLMPAYRTTFHGILLSVRLNVRAAGELVLLTPKRHATLTRRGVERELIDIGGTGEPLDRLYRCSATDQAIADRILTAKVRDSLTAMARRLGHNRLQVAVSGDTAYLTLATRKRWFGGSRSTDFIGVAEIRQFVNDITNVIALAQMTHDLDNALQDDGPGPALAPRTDVEHAMAESAGIPGHGLSAA